MLLSVTSLGSYFSVPRYTEFVKGRFLAVLNKNANTCCCPPPPFSVSFSLLFNQLQRSFLSPSFRKDPLTIWDYLFLHTPSTTRLPHLGICVRKSRHLEFVLLEYVLENTTFHSLGYKLLCPTSLKFWLPKAGAVYSPRIVDYEMLFYHLEMRITDALQIGLLSIR